MSATWVASECGYRVICGHPEDRRTAERTVAGSNLYHRSGGSIEWRRMWRQNQFIDNRCPPRCGWLTTDKLVWPSLTDDTDHDRRSYSSWPPASCDKSRDEQCALSRHAIGNVSDLNLKNTLFNVDSRNAFFKLAFVAMFILFLCLCE